jgi:hypothetical protein
MENTSSKDRTDSHSTTSLQIPSFWYTSHRKTKKKTEGDVTILEAGTGDSPFPRSDDDD